MKKLLFLLLSISILFGCEMIELDDFMVYDQISEPHLSGPTPWVLYDYEVIVVSAISGVEVILNDTICINAFGEQSYLSGDILMKQNYESTSADRRFIIGKTLWEFDDNSYSLYINGNVDDRYGVIFPNYLMKEYDKMIVQNLLTGSNTNYSFSTNAQGANYTTKLKLLSPPIVSDLLLSNGMRDKAVTVQILLTFMRN